MFTFYATSGGGLTVHTAETAAPDSLGTGEIMSNPTPKGSVPTEAYPYWYEMAPPQSLAAPTTSAKAKAPSAQKTGGNAIVSNVRPVHYAVSGAVALISLNRPAVLNAIDLEMVTLLRTCLHETSTDRRIRAVIITGAGRGFCAGGDLRFAITANPTVPGDAFLALTAVLHAAIVEIRTMAKPVIAAINGPAAGG